MKRTLKGERGLAHPNRRPSNFRQGVGGQPSRLQSILDLASEGLTDREIAERLDISPHTVETYWKRLRHHYGLSTRAAILVQSMKDELATALLEIQRLSALLHETGELGSESAPQRGSVWLSLPDSVDSFSLHACGLMYQMSAERPYELHWVKGDWEALGHSATDKSSLPSVLGDLMDADDLRSYSRVLKSVKANQTPAQTLVPLVTRSGDKRLYLDMRHAAGMGKKQVHRGFLYDCQALSNTGILHPGIGSEIKVLTS